MEYVLRKERPLSSRSTPLRSLACSSLLSPLAPPLAPALALGCRPCRTSVLFDLARSRCSCCRPPTSSHSYTMHPIPTLPHTDPVCSPVAPRVSGLLPQGGDLPSAGMGGPKPRVLGACGGCDPIHDLGARTHSCMRSHAGSQCV